MKKITKISNYGTDHGLRLLQAGLSPHEQEMLTGSNHTIHFIDKHSFEANGVLEHAGEVSNYRYFVEVGGEVVFQGNNLSVVALQYPHIIVREDGKERPIHVVKYVASSLTEMV